MSQIGNYIKSSFFRDKKTNKTIIERTAEILADSFRKDRDVLEYLDNKYFECRKKNIVCLLSRKPQKTKFLHNRSSTAFFEYILEGLKNGSITITDKRFEESLDLETIDCPNNCQQPKCYIRAVICDSYKCDVWKTHQNNWSEASKIRNNQCAGKKQAHKN